MKLVLQGHNELCAKAVGEGRFFAKKSAMVAQTGKWKYEKRLLGTNDNDGLGRQILNRVTRGITGENLEIMEVTGSGTVYLADNAMHTVVVDLEEQGAFQTLSVESENLVAFTPNCHYEVEFIGAGVISQRGLFTTRLRYTGPGCQAIITTDGNPIVLDAPCEVDPDAVVAWTGKGPKVKLNTNWKTFIGQTSGESYTYEFTDPNQTVIVQPKERRSGLVLGIDDKQYKPHKQESTNPINEVRDTANRVSDTLNRLTGRGNVHTGQQFGQGYDSNYNQGYNNYNQGYNDYNGYDDYNDYDDRGRW